MKELEQTLQTLYEKGDINKAAYLRGLTLIGYTPDSSQWRTYLERALLGLGIGLFLAGVIFFFAYNWQNMGRFTKFGVIEGGIVAAVVIAIWRRLDTLEGKIALTAAAVLVGALLAVVGQTYQVIAAAYSLFIIWAGLIAGWVIIGRFSPLWLTWQVIANIGYILYTDLDELFNEPRPVIVLFLANFLGLVLWELSHRLGWTKQRLYPRITAICLIGLLIPRMTGYVSSIDPMTGEDMWIVGLYFLFTLGSLAIYMTVIRDLPILAMLGMGAIVILMVLSAEALDNIDDIIQFFLLGLLLIGLVVQWVFILRQIDKRWERIDERL